MQLNVSACERSPERTQSPRNNSPRLASLRRAGLQESTPIKHRASYALHLANWSATASGPQNQAKYSSWHYYRSSRTLASAGNYSALSSQVSSPGGTRGCSSAARQNLRSVPMASTVTLAGAAQAPSKTTVTRCLSLFNRPHPPAGPNPSLKRSTNCMPPSPGRLYAVHFRQPGLGVLPSSPA